MGNGSLIFIERPKLVAEIVHRVRRPDSRLLTVWGPRGSGKTFLLTEWVAQALVQSNFPVFIYDLTGRRNVELPTSPSPFLHDKESVLALLKELSLPGAKRTLLILDQWGRKKDSEVEVESSIAFDLFAALVRTHRRIPLVLLVCCREEDLYSVLQFERYVIEPLESHKRIKVPLFSVDEAANLIGKYAKHHGLGWSDDIAFGMARELGGNGFITPLLIHSLFHSRSTNPSTFQWNQAEKRTLLAANFLNDLLFECALHRSDDYRLIRAILKAFCVIGRRQRGVTSLEIADEVRTSRKKASTMLKQLVDRGILTRQPKPNDEGNLYSLSERNLDSIISKLEELIPMEYTRRVELSWLTSFFFRIPRDPKYAKELARLALKALQEGHNREFGFGGLYMIRRFYAGEFDADPSSSNLILVRTAYRRLFMIYLINAIVVIGLTSALLLLWNNWTAVLQFLR